MMSQQSMFSQFSQSANGVYFRAVQEATLLMPRGFGTPHILLGLLGEEKGLVREVFTYFSLELDQVREQIVSSFGSPVGDLIVFPETAGAILVREEALNESLVLGYAQIEVIHLLLALSRQVGSAAAKILASLDVDMEDIHNKAMSVLSRSGYDARSGFDDVAVPSKEGIDKTLEHFEWLGCQAKAERNRYNEDAHCLHKMRDESAPSQEDFTAKMSYYKEIIATISRHVERLQFIRRHCAE